MLLRNIGHEVIGKALNGEEAVKKYLSFSIKPDLIIMDYRMPVKNGIEACKDILKYTNNVRIIFASADNSVEKIVLSLGVLCFLSKPFEIQELITQIGKALTKSIF